MANTRNIMKRLKNGVTYTGLGAFISASFISFKDNIQSLFNLPCTSPIPFPPHDLIGASNVLLQIFCTGFNSIVNSFFKFPNRFTSEQIILVGGMVGCFYGLVKYIELTHTLDEKIILATTLPLDERLEAIEFPFTQIPPDFICPITHCVMTNPVVACDGHTYEYQAIKEWLAIRMASPKENQILTSKMLILNKLLKSQILEFVETAENRFWVDKNIIDLNRLSR